ncbi:hypothetical protein BH10BDE1_BH10BDE1_02760 [soil metagenome]
MKKSVGFVLLSLFFSYSARAGINLKLDLEARLQRKIQSVISPVDPNVQVLVTVNLQKISTELPGAGVEVTGLMSDFRVTEFSPNDIASIDVAVISKFKVFPESLTTLVKNAAQLPGVNVKVSFQKADQVTTDAIESRAHEERYLDQFSTYFEMQRSHQNIFYLICAVLLLLMGAMIVSIVFVSKVVQRGLLKIERAVQVSSEGQAHSSAPVLEAQIGRPQILESRLNPHDSDHTYIQSLSVESMAGLLSDCYWCEEDQYAAWLWSNMSPDQRTQISSVWTYCHSYIKTLSGETSYKAHHNHPYYLKPLKLWNVSQSDVGLWLKENPSTWSMLSPLRQEKLDLPLMEKLNYFKVESSGVVPALPTPTPTYRRLETNFAISEISEADEIEILTSYASIPQNVRKQIQSLVWMALLPEEACTEILAKMSAQQISQAWIGPEQVLSRLASLLPEKKLKLLREYCTKITPDRKSVPMQFLVQEALKKLSDSNVEKNGGQSAA